MWKLVNAHFVIKNFYLLHCINIYININCQVPRYHLLRTQNYVYAYSQSLIVFQLLYSEIETDCSIPIKSPGFNFPQTVAHVLKYNALILFHLSRMMGKNMSKKNNKQNRKENNLTRCDGIYSKKTFSLRNPTKVNKFLKTVKKRKFTKLQFWSKEKGLRF